MTGPTVCVVRTGLANLASVLAGLSRAGAEAYISESPAEVAKATHVVLPGVGAFGAAMAHLKKCGLVDPLRDRLNAGRPTACVCVGMQLLCEESEESPGVEGIGVVKRKVQRLPNTVRVPQLGWNQVEPCEEAKLLDSGYAYFANSYCIPEPPEGWNYATTEHGIRLTAAIEKGPLLGCQFHPELSGVYGLELIKRWLAAAES
jgi:imidazole glycerol-phosphate synthase subunit HisH